VEGGGEEGGVEEEGFIWEGSRVVVWWCGGRGRGKYTASFVEICHTVHT